MRTGQGSNDCGTPVFIAHLTQDDLPKKTRSKCDVADLRFGDFAVHGPVVQVRPLPEDSVEVDEKRVSHCDALGSNL